MAAIRHIWTSPDRLILVRGLAGVGKTTALKVALDGVAVPHVALAVSAQASRGELRDAGIEGAETVARFLVDADLQEQARGGLIVLDEGSLIGSSDMYSLCQAADSLDARVLVLGDRRQHKSVARGDVLAMLEDRAGLPVAEVSEIKRQSGEYKRAVELLARGKVAQGFRKLDDLGWVKEANQFPDARNMVGRGEPDHGGDLNDMIATDYLAALRAGKSVLVIDPTHAGGEKVTAAIREKLKQDGRLKGEERVFERLVPLHLTEAEKALPDSFPDGAVAQYVRSARGVKAGQRVRVDRDAVQDVARHGGRVAVFRPDDLRLAAGDSVRITANGESLDGHRLNNGTVYTVTGFDNDGNIRLNNGWLLGKDFGHLSYGYTSTSHAAQGRTVDRVLIAQGSQSLPATGAEQFYVSVSRGRQQATIYTDDKQALFDAVQREDHRLLASDLVRQPRLGLRQRLKKHLAFLRKVATLGRDHEHTRQPQLEYQHDR